MKCPPTTVFYEVCNYENLLNRIGLILETSSVERQFVEHVVEKIEMESGKKLSPANRKRMMHYAARALRCNIARMLSQKDFREMAIQLADSLLLHGASKNSMNLSLCQDSAYSFSLTVA